MKRAITMLAFVFLILGVTNAQFEIYKRTLINVPTIEPTGFGNFVAGVDLDGDGKLEVYAVNNNWNDAGAELIPRIYKFERNTSGGWDAVWSATMNIPLQNTWPTLCVADLDGDGKKEIVWGPINNTDATTNPNPARIIVFEVKGDGSDILGVPDGSGGYNPNTSWTITTEASKNIRPFKMQAWDFNNDGKSELVFTDRANSVYRFGVVGVNNVPNDGVQTGVVWSFKYEGLVSNTAIHLGTYYDFAIVDSTIFFFNTNGASQPVTYANGVYTLRATQLAVIPGGSWKSSATYNFDGAGSKEIIISGWTATAANKKVRVLQKATDSTLTEAVALDVSALLGASGQAFGGVLGDIDNDGKPDFVFGSRDAGAKVFRVEYQGGGLGTAGNYTISGIDRGVVSTATRIGELAMANVDGKAGDEVFYSSSVDGRVPIVVLSDGKNAVNVTFNANTSGVPDTLKSNSFVQIRGSAAQITWGLDSPAKLTNAGDDYWKYTGLFATGDTIAYKYFTNAKSVVPSADEHKGWEGDIITFGNGNRRLIVGSSDMNLPLDYVNGFNGTNFAQYDAPFNNNQTDDTVWVYLKVNMQGALASTLFDPAKHKVGVRGSFASSQWGTTIIMKPMADHANVGSRQYGANNFYTVAIKWVKSLLDSASSEKTMRFKYVIHKIASPNNEDWSQMVDNPDGNVGEFQMPKKDTTFYWTWYRGQPYVVPPGQDTVTVKFRTDLTTALTQKGWKPGDSVVVKYGYGSTAAQVFTEGLSKVGLTGNFFETKSLVVPGVSVGKQVQYQYYLVNGDVREIFYDFGYSGPDPGAAERRKFDVTAKNASLTVLDTSKSITSMRRQPTWQNTGKLSKNVLVTFTCDLRPAFYHLAGGDSLFDVQNAFRTILPSDKDSVYKWGVWINGPAVGGWGNPGGDWGNGLRTNLAKKMYDDGTNGDAVAGDRIYTKRVQFYKDSINNTIGQVFKFGLYAGDNEGGKGGFGNNHVENIDDAGATATIASQFGSINPTYFKAWDYNNKRPTGIERTDNVIPEVFSLDQNYPNPFNPSTSIRYSIPTESHVTLKIYNMLGQEVATVVNETMTPGKYTATFNASRLASGVYIYRIEAGSFTSVKKMMLLK